MGVLYTVVPAINDVSVWLTEMGVEFPKSEASRSPLLAEIANVLASLDGYTIEYSDNGTGNHWRAEITFTASPESGPWTVLNITTLNEPTMPQEIWFEKGYPELIVDIVARLSKRCGILVIIPDTGCTPLVVSPASDPTQLCGVWEHITG